LLSKKLLVQFIDTLIQIWRWNSVAQLFDFSVERAWLKAFRLNYERVRSSCSRFKEETQQKEFLDVQKILKISYLDRYMKISSLNYMNVNGLP